MTYSCAYSERDEGWPEWEDANANTASIGYFCVTQEWDPELEDSWDCLCKPQFSESALKMDDGTAPRFHCFGTYDTESEDVEFHCEPYWNLKPEIRKRGGSGWFLWLALQARPGEERDQLTAIANQIAERQTRESLASLEKLRHETVRSVEHGGDVTAEEEENLKAALRRLDEEAERAKAPRSSDEIRRRTAAERERWEKNL